MRLSILDQAPISTNQTAKEALIEALKLAQAGESLGYTRYWIAEHHDLAGLACSAPEVMLSYIGANTNIIRIGSGAVLLPHYKPYKVAEVYNTLATLFSDRIDIGIGRAPGGSAEATNALSDNYLQQVWNMPESVKELVHFLNNDFPPDHQFANVNAAPIPDEPPIPWILGTSRKSAQLAAENGLAYAFGQFMSDKDGGDIIRQYRNSFTPKKTGDKPNVILTVSAFCADTFEKAESLALSSLIWAVQKEKGEGKGVPAIEKAREYKLTNQEKASIKAMKDQIVIGNPKEVSHRFKQLQNDYDADEIMIVTITHSPEDRIHSYELIANELLRTS